MCEQTYRGRLAYQVVELVPTTTAQTTTVSSTRRGRLVAIGATVFGAAALVDRGLLKLSVNPPNAEQMMPDPVPVDVYADPNGRLPIGYMVEKAETLRIGYQLTTGATVTGAVVTLVFEVDDL